MKYVYIIRSRDEHVGMVATDRRERLLGLLDENWTENAEAFCGLVKILERSDDELLRNEGWELGENLNSDPVLTLHVVPIS